MALPPLGILVGAIGLNLRPPVPHEGCIRFYDATKVWKKVDKGWFLFLFKRFS